MFGEIEDVIPEQGFTAGEDDDGLSHLGDFIQQFEPLVGIQLSLVRTVGGRGPAMNTGEIAVSGRLPGHQAKGIALALSLAVGQIFFFQRGGVDSWVALSFEAINCFDGRWLSVQGRTDAVIR
jgi:hypothetical protein